MNMSGRTARIRARRDLETTLHGLLGKLLAPYAELGGERVRLLGDDAPIGVKAATSLALILHELATNAAKYGALGRAGRLRHHHRGTAGRPASA